MPVTVVFRCAFCDARPDPETQISLEHQLLDLRHGEYVDADPGHWLVWRGRGIYGPDQYACGEHRGELKAMLREQYGPARLAPVGDGAASVGGPARNRPGSPAGAFVALHVRSTGLRVRRSGRLLAVSS